MHPFIARKWSACAAILALALCAGTVGAQGAERLGDFSIEAGSRSTTGQDSSFAVLWPGGRHFSREVSAGLLLLACGGDSESMGGAFLLPAFGGAGDTLVLALRMGQAPADTVVLDAGGEGDIGWLMRDRDVEPFLRRALASDSLSVEMLGGSVPGERMTYAYSLAQLDTVLARLRCTVAPHRPGRTAGRGIVQHLSSGMTSAEPGERVGNFSIEARADSVTGQRRSFAALRPRGGYLSPAVYTGSMFLACGDDDAALGGAAMLPAFGGTGDTLVLAVRVGQAPPDTIILDADPEGGTGWFVRDPDLEPLLRRARAGDSLFVEMLGGSGAADPAAYAYPLAGLDTVLARLGCRDAPPAPGRLTGRSALQQLLAGAVPHAAIVDARLINGSEARRHMERAYPAELRRTGARGEVTVRFRVGEDGLVDPGSVQVLRSTNEAFNAGAMEAVRQFRFRPATAYGRPVRVWIDLPLIFELP